MTSHRFFISQPLQLDKELVLEAAVSRHINLSLRLSIGANITPTLQKIAHLKIHLLWGEPIFNVTLLNKAAVLTPPLASEKK